MAGLMKSPRAKRSGLGWNRRSLVTGALACVTATLSGAALSRAEVPFAPELGPRANTFQTEVNDFLAARPSDVEVAPLTRLFIERADLETWAKDTIGTAETQRQLVGAGIVVFRPEGAVLAKGFGYSDFEKRDPVHPSVTYLPAAQLGNLFVAELLVDLESAGHLNLDDEADDYLTRVKLPAADRHLTIRDLFGSRTHLSSSIRGTHTTRETDEASSLGHIRSLLRQAAPADRNNSTPPPLASALAALIAEDVSGQKIENGISRLLAERWNVAAWFNTAGSQQPKYTSQHHRISRFGKVERRGFPAASQGFVASQGLYMTLNDMTKILTSQLKGLNEKSQHTDRVTQLAFTRKEVGSALAGADGSVELLELKGNVSTSSIHIILIPDLEVGFFSVVNSANRVLDLAPVRGRTRNKPPLVASDISENFLRRFIQKQPTERALPPSAEALADHYAQPADTFIGPDRVYNLVAPLRTSSSANGLLALFSLSIVLQFALLAAARWPAATEGQKMAKWLGMASVVFMTATLAFPVALLALGHSRTLIDPLYQASRWAFPIAGLMATATVVACIIGWKRGFWGDESDGFRRRLCFTVGSTGIFGLAVVTWQLDLIVPVF